MGPTQSKNIVDIVNETSASAIISAMSNCNSGVSQSQTMILSGSNTNLHQTQDASINLSCAANFRIDSTIINDITNKIIQSAAAEGYGLLSPGGSNSENVTNIRNSVSASVTTELIQRVISQINQQQTMIAQYDSVNKNIYQNQTASVIQKSITDAIASTGLGNSVAGNFDQDANASSKNPFDFIGNLFKLPVYMMLIIAVFILVLVLGIVYAIFN